MGESNYKRKDSSQISELVSVNKDPHEIIAEVVGPEFMEYRMSWEDAVSFKQRIPYPLHIDFEVSFKCNLKCQMCIMNLPKEELQRYGNYEEKIEFETFKTIIDEGATSGLRSVGFNGINEPLLQTDICEWIEYAKKKGVLDIMFNTNGLLLNEDISRRLIESGLTRIMFSIDAATKETYKEVRGSDSYELVVKNIERFIEIKEEMKNVLPLVRVSFIKMHNNIHEIDKFKEIWRDKVDFFSIQRYGNPLLNNEKFFDDFEKYHVDEEIKDIGFKCPEPWVRLMIRYNGDINPCCGIQGPKLVVGNIHKDKIKDVWDSRQMEILRNIHEQGQFKNNEICRLCAESFRYS